MVEVTTAFVHLPIGPKTSLDDVRNNLDERTIIADMAVMQGTNTGVGLVGVIEAQLRSVGMPSWYWTKSEVLDRIENIPKVGVSGILPGPGLLFSWEHQSLPSPLSVTHDPKHLHPSPVFVRLPALSLVVPHNHTILPLVCFLLVLQCAYCKSRLIYVSGA